MSSLPNSSTERLQKHEARKTEVLYIGRACSVMSLNVLFFLLFFFFEYFSYIFYSFLFFCSSILSLVDTMQ